VREFAALECSDTNARALVLKLLEHLEYALPFPRELALGVEARACIVPAAYAGP
jgi:hypothetical protein